ncbi:MAG: hypothetical protein ACE5FF_10880, partial [Saprospiraceae bacterium]
PYLLFTIFNRWGEMIRQLKTSPKKGVNRIVWDGRYPSKDPVSLQTGQRAPWQLPEGGGFAMPGGYYVSLDKVVSGERTKLTDGQRFNLMPLSGTTLPAEDLKALNDYVQKAAELERAFQGATKTLGELKNTLKFIRRAAGTIGSPVDMLADIKAMDEKMRSLNKAFYGDGTASRLDQPAPPSLMGRIYGMSYDIWSSTSAPTSTMQEQLDIATTLFEAELPKLRELVEVDLKNIEKKLEDAKAPYTPGRLPEWGGK